MAEIHLLENNNRIQQIGTGSTFESGYWANIGFLKASCLRKAEAWILFHTSQESAAREGAKRGGKIIGFRVHKGPDYPEFENRIVFIYEELPEAIGRKTPKKDWQSTAKILGC